MVKAGKTKVTAKIKGKTYKWTLTVKKWLLAVVIYNDFHSFVNKE